MMQEVARPSNLRDGMHRFHVLQLVCQGCSTHGCFYHLFRVCYVTYVRMQLCL
jgi:hypothetical protein